MLPPRLLFLLDRQPADGDGLPTYRTGEVLSGRVALWTEAGEALEVDGLDVSLRWRAHGGSDETVQLVESQSAPQGRIAADGSSGFGFRFTLPRGPFSHRGELSHLTWELIARARLPGALDARARQEITLQAHPEVTPSWSTASGIPEAMPRALQSDPGPPGLGEHLQAFVESPGYLLFAGIVLTIVSGVMLRMSVFPDGIGSFNLETIPWPLQAFAATVIVCLIASLVRIGIQIARHSTTRQVGPVEIEIEPRRLRAGQSLRVGLVCRPRTRLKLRGARAVLKAQERASTSQRLESETIYETSVLLNGQQVFDESRPVEFSGSLEIPADPPPTFYTHNNDLHWTITLHLDLAGRGDWLKEEPLFVHP